VASGVHQVANGNYRNEILFTWGSDNEVWGASNVYNADNVPVVFNNFHLNNVADISCFGNYGGSYLQQFNYISTNGVEMIDSNLYGAGYVWNGAWTY
jgi:hypothetical protein